MLTRKPMDAEAMYRTILQAPERLPVRFSLDGCTQVGLPETIFQRTAARETREDGLCRAVLCFALRGERPLTARLDLELDERFGVLAWTLYFENRGEADSPVISDVDALHLLLPGENPVLKGILGDHVNSYAPYERKLCEEETRFFCDSGRPTHEFFPYFNLEIGDGGCFVVLGWAGTWEAVFTGEDGGARLIGRGTNGLHAYLKPGEVIRTPRMLLLPYAGRNEDDAMNLWRRYYVARVLPKEADGAPLRPFSTTCLCYDTGLPNSDGSISERYSTWRPSMEKLISEGIHMDYRWFDAGWYMDADGNTVPSEWWSTIGTWTLDPVKWPGGSFRESTDYARAHGMKTLMWFEPERTTHVDSLCRYWGYKKEWALEGGGNDIGQRECLEWTLDRILSTLEKGGVEMYREDNNFNARPCWRALDAQMGEDRQGITENRAVMAHYEMWDRIIAFTMAHGGASFVDSCASGGGRNDLESMRRAVPLLRSDSDRTTTALRLSMTTAFDRWIPFCGAACTEQKGQLDPDGRRDRYILRASYLPVLNLNAQWTQDPATDFDQLRWALNEWGRVKPYLLKDFYVLTPWHPLSFTEGWTAFAYHDPETDGAVLQAFRMENAEDETITVRLPFLDPDAEYDVENADDGTIERRQGRALIDLTLHAPQRRTAILWFLSRVAAGLSG